MSHSFYAEVLLIYDIIVLVGWLKHGGPRFRSQRGVAVWELVLQGWILIARTSQLFPCLWAESSCGCKYKILVSLVRMGLKAAEGSRLVFKRGTKGLSTEESGNAASQAEKIRMESVVIGRNVRDKPVFLEL